jgi:hypothetical protein
MNPKAHQTNAEIRRLVPASVRDDLAEAGFIVVPRKSAYAMRHELENAVEFLLRYPRSTVANHVRDQALHILSLADETLEHTMPERPTIPLPPRVSKLPMFRGLPVPYVTFVDPNTGQPDFRVLDLERQQQCIREKMCGICGEPLGKFIAFIGGPGSGRSHVFTDPGMHRSCAEYTAKVCPFVSRDIGVSRG